MSVILPALFLYSFRFDCSLFYLLQTFILTTFNHFMGGGYIYILHLWFWDWWSWVDNSNWGNNYIEYMQLSVNVGSCTCKALFWQSQLAYTPHCTYWNPGCSFDVRTSTFSKGLYDPGPGYGTGDCIIFLSVVDLKGAVATLGESVTSLSLIV